MTAEPILGRQVIDSHPARQQLPGIAALLFVLAGLLAAASPATNAYAAELTQRPNILLILADDLGYGSVGCYGADPELIRTPHIDRLAREGRRFTDASCPSSVCTPTRYGLLTGRYCWRTSLRHGVLSPAAPLLLDVDRLNLAALLKERGYATAAIGKWHLGYGSAAADFTGRLQPGPLQLGFDDHFGVPQNHGDFIGTYVENETVFGLRSARLQPSGAKTEKGQPLLGLDAPQRVSDEVSPTLSRRAAAWLERQASDRPFLLYFAPVAVHEPITPSAATAGTSKAGPYGDWIHELDRSVGEVLDVLDRRQLAANTIVLFTSDNGGVVAPAQKRPETVAYERGLRPNGALRGGKASAYEGGFRVPYIVRWPGHVPANSLCGEMISLVDTLATVAAITGVSLPAAEIAAGDSYNVLPTWLAEPHAALRASMITHSDDGTFAVRQDDWKYIEGRPAVRKAPKNDKPGQPVPHIGAPRPQLFNLAEDPAETRDLAAARPDVCARLQRLLDEARHSPATRPR